MKDGNVFKILRVSLKDSVIKSNNRRAIVIHFILSALGLFSTGLILGLILEIVTVPDSSAIVPFTFLGIAFVGLFVYLICGYKFLKPSKENTALSVFWLTGMTSILSMLTIVYVVLLRIEESFGLHIFEAGTVETVMLPFGYFNTVGMGVLAALGFFDFGLSTLVSILLLIIVALLPPGMLSMGLKLKINKQNNPE